MKFSPLQFPQRQRWPFQRRKDISAMWRRTAVVWDHLNPTERKDETVLVFLYYVIILSLPNIDPKEGYTEKSRYATNRLINLS